MESNLDPAWRFVAQEYARLKSEGVSNDQLYARLLQHLSDLKRRYAEMGVAHGNINRF